MQLEEVVGIKTVGCRHDGIINSNCIGFWIDKAESAHDTCNMRINDKRSFAQGAEVQRGGSDLAAYAINLLEPE